ncbi:hypothetical protein CIB84_016651 [Bambusicola thoracicus]|uniref:Uncharacterized protein n=1 Tax=Bambusicola thoracicus TaxID=9083 RepID=A0A2P4S658_BAMTH|nr:hypothetical protein CIB84_016651 [Bambusicola thoracicus]
MLLGEGHEHFKTLQWGCSCVSRRKAHICPKKEAESHLDLASVPGCTLFQGEKQLLSDLAALAPATRVTGKGRHQVLPVGF